MVSNGIRGVLLSASIFSAAHSAQRPAMQHGPEVQRVIEMQSLRRPDVILASADAPIKEENVSGSREAVTGLTIFGSAASAWLMDSTGIIDRFVRRRKAPKNDSGR